MGWQDVLALFAVVAAGLYLARAGWRAMRPAVDGRGGCGSCGSCPSGSTDAPPGEIVTIGTRPAGR